MRSGSLRLGATGLGLTLLLVPLARPAAYAADAAHPTVVELFQSQGCSSCPPANANVMALADRPDLLVLSWQVTYWDQLGWKDSFGKPEFTQRQRDYANAFHRPQVFTPEVVVNGRDDVVGNRRDAIEALIVRADRGNGGPAIRIIGNQVTVSAADANARLVLVRYNPAILQVPIQRGENAGLTLPHRNVVRQVAVLAETDPHGAYTLPAAPEPGLRTAILVQAGAGGAIMAALAAR